MIPHTSCQPLCLAPGLNYLFCFSRAPRQPGRHLPVPWVSRNGYSSFEQLRGDSACSFLKCDPLAGPSSAASCWTGSSRRLTDSFRVLKWFGCGNRTPKQPSGIFFSECICIALTLRNRWNGFTSVVCYCRMSMWCNVGDWYLFFVLNPQFFYFFVTNKQTNGTKYVVQGLLLHGAGSSVEDNNSLLCLPSLS